MNVISTSPESYVPCERCGHLPCPFCVTSCDDSVEIKPSPEEVAARRASILSGNGQSEITLDRARTMLVQCDGCEKSVAAGAVHARSRMPGWFRRFCSAECVEAWCVGGEWTMCPCVGEKCVYPAGGAAQNERVIEWLYDEMKRIGSDSCGVDESARAIVYDSRSEDEARQKKPEHVAEKIVDDIVLDMMTSRPKLDQAWRSMGDKRSDARSAWIAFARKRLESMLHAHVRKP